MPLVPFDALPESARIWIFASDRPLEDTDADRLLAETDRFLAQWQAHGAPLRAARDFRDDRFLVIGVDPTAAQASGCSIDGLYRVLRGLEAALGSSLLAGGRVFYRDPRGEVQGVSRDEWAELGEAGAVSGQTRVFDTTVETAGDLRERFEMEAARGWQGALLAPVG